MISGAEFPQEARIQMSKQKMKNTKGKEIPLIVVALDGCFITQI